MKRPGIKNRFKYQSARRLFVASATVADTVKIINGETQETIKRPQTALRGSLISFQATPGGLYD